MPLSLQKQNSNICLLHFLLRPGISLFVKWADNSQHQRHPVSKWAWLISIAATHHTGMQLKGCYSCGRASGPVLRRRRGRMCAPNVCNHPDTSTISKYHAKKRLVKAVLFLTFYFLQGGTRHTWSTVGDPRSAAVASINNTGRPAETSPFLNRTC